MLKPLQYPVQLVFIKWHKLEEEKKRQRIEAFMTTVKEQIKP